MKKEDLPSKTAIIIYIVISVILFIIFINCDNDLSIIGDFIVSIVLGIPATIIFIIGHVVIENLINYK